jgi:hypothetical protein
MGGPPTQRGVPKPGDTRFARVPVSACTRATEDAVMRSQPSLRAHRATAGGVSTGRVPSAASHVAAVPWRSQSSRPSAIEAVVST